MIDGDTFLGTYATVVVREDAAVIVSYKQSQRTAKADERTTGLVARELLGWLVRDDLASGGRNAMHGSRRSVSAPAFGLSERSLRRLAD